MLDEDTLAPADAEELGLHGVESPPTSCQTQHFEVGHAFPEAAEVEAMTHLAAAAMASVLQIADAFEDSVKWSSGQ